MVANGSGATSSGEKGRVHYTVYLYIVYLFIDLSIYIFIYIYNRYGYIDIYIYRDMDLLDPEFSAAPQRKLLCAVKNRYGYRDI